MRAPCMIHKNTKNPRSCPPLGRRVLAAEHGDVLLARPPPPHTSLLSTPSPLLCKLTSPPQPSPAPLLRLVHATSAKMNMGDRQDWDTVVIRKRAPTAGAAKDKSAVAAAVRSGAEVETQKKFAAGSNKAATGAPKDAAKLDRETEELHHDRCAATPRLAEGARVLVAPGCASLPAARALCT